MEFQYDATCSVRSDEHTLPPVGTIVARKRAALPWAQWGGGKANESGVVISDAMVMTAGVMNRSMVTDDVEAAIESGLLKAITFVESGGDPVE